MTSWRLYRSADDALFKGMGLGFVACLISIMITNAFGDRWTYLPLGAYFWVFLGIVTRMHVIIERERIGVGEMEVADAK